MDKRRGKSIITSMSREDKALWWTACIIVIGMIALMLYQIYRWHGYQPPIEPIIPIAQEQIPFYPSQGKE